jgi:predicted nucleic acid-binding protein
MYLIDTDVLSELRKRQAEPRVLAWMQRQRTSDLFLSVVTVGEIERGIRLRQASDPGFAGVLAAWLDTVLAVYGDRILAFDLSAARRWGVLSAALGNREPDVMIAATALEHGLIIVTRNVAHFQPTGVPLLNPFLAG